MKLFKFLFLVTTVVMFTACGDDDSDCIQADWVGTYTGTSDCDGTIEEATVTITASGTDRVVVITEIPGLESEYDPIDLDGCSLEESKSEAGLTLSVDATLDGDNLTFREVISAGGQSSTCTITATRN